MYIKLDKDREVKCTLGTIRDIEKKFNKGFYEILRGLDKMTVTEQIRLLYVGVGKADPNLSEESFAEICDEYLGMGELQESLENFLYQLQYPGLSNAEIQEKIQKKLQIAKDRN